MGGLKNYGNDPTKLATLAQPWGNSHYEIWGEGPPLLLLNGLGFSRWSWQWQRSLRLRCLVWEHRGFGGSDPGERDFSLAELADDALALLDHLQLERTVVFGVSMGGMVAQEFALRHPHRCAGLVLGCTWCGGAETVKMTPEVQQRMTEVAEKNWSLEALRDVLDLSFSPGWIASQPQEVEHYLSLRLQHQSRDFLSWSRQRKASLRFNSSQRLGEFRGPTLLLHGGDDQVVPLDNLGVLRQRLPQAQTFVFAEARHLFWIEGARQLQPLLESFARQCWPS